MRSGLFRGHGAILGALVVAVAAGGGEAYARTIDLAVACCEKEAFPGPVCSEELPAECVRSSGTPGLGDCVNDRCVLALPWCCERNGFPGPFCSMDAPAACLRQGGVPAAGVCDPAGGRCLPLF